MHVATAAILARGIGMFVDKYVCGNPSLPSQSNRT